MDPKQGNLQRLSKGDREKFKRSVITFHEKSKKLKEVQAKYLKLKADWTREMSNFFFVNAIDKAVRFDSYDDSFEGNKKEIIVRRIQNTSVVFDPDKLEKKLGKKLSKDAIDKRYEIIDMQGLTNYLKELDADPAIFKSFISVQKTVNTEVLDQMEKLGKISQNDIEGCYIIKKQDPYFTVKEGKGQGGD